MKLPIMGLAAVNLAAFVMFGLDKWFAIHGMWRISERALFGVALLGGSPGAILGMVTFHHKTLHRTFSLGLPLLLAAQLLLCVWLWKKGFLPF